MNQQRRRGGWGRGIFRNKPQCATCQRGDCIPMSELEKGRSATVHCNNDLRTIERGIYLGALITMFRNDLEEPNIIVAVGDSRYVLDRRIAQNIRVRVS
ncbi:MAG: ferrous iron transport protein A [Candidatus Cloacimonetes bacterium]|nr:ferrous iron transport protein A [Candidatus Cloacimonadota bacterium]MCB5287780.1 ferrous iron transport protein A [Candidatus Cloacimonadota bacterium]MCK9183781.1 ferrous iron transport protein A [Candidatus Cloacimonadota bacterium]MCK9584337.1 ferrous iron transport protein A [Candidatus Cloacimonadota bacterium]MDY0230101.1 FeoA family protein [Candidatus Cloacimonadaceae bacterium]